MDKHTIRGASPKKKINPLYKFKSVHLSNKDKLTMETFDMKYGQIKDVLKLKVFF